MCLLMGLIAASLLLTVVVGAVFNRRLQVKYLIETGAGFFWDSIRMPMAAFGTYSPGELLSRYKKGYSFANTTAVFLITAIAMGIKYSTISEVEPLIQAVPETPDDEKLVMNLSGVVTVSGLRFRYDQSSPYVIDGVDISIRPVEYVAFAGPSGCKGCPEGHGNSLLLDI